MTWRETVVAPSGTHHLRGGSPLYADRFDAVLAFHEPGLAPVRMGDDAWHVRLDGSPAYSRRFLQTFGFYEGRAAVESSSGWHHILPDGSDLYAERLAWCGNFQGSRCTVRDEGWRYHHLTLEGKPAYQARWRYAGDFRDGMAVVQAEDGRSTHIDLHGGFVHGAWFLDLDVFHKGYARARDDAGWTHVDTAGEAIYARRFAAVEPFYNGQARVECFDGRLAVIDETGELVGELRAPLRSDFATLSSDLVGFWRTQTICAAVELGVVEALPAKTRELAHVCGLEPARARRLLRALAELGLTRLVDGSWTLTERGAHLRASHPMTLGGAAIEYGRFFTDMWRSLPAAMRQESAWSAPDIFAEVAADASRSTRHHVMLSSYARHGYGAVPQALGLQGHERVIDAGGGLGTLAAMLTETYPCLHVIVLDRPEVIRQAAAPLAPRGVELRTADIFAPWGVSADAVVMARVLHDWDDGPALQLLRHARAALGHGGRLFVIEMLIAEDSVAGSTCDLHLLMATGGMERTAGQYRALLEQAGFRWEGVRPLGALPDVIVGVAG